MSDPTAEYLMAKSRLHQHNAIKLMSEREGEGAVIELMSMLTYLNLSTTNARDNATGTNTTSNATV